MLIYLQIERLKLKRINFITFIQNKTNIIAIDHFHQIANYQRRCRNDHFSSFLAAINHPYRFDVCNTKIVSPFFSNRQLSSQSAADIFVNKFFFAIKWTFPQLSRGSNLRCSIERSKATFEIICQ